jgi:hypothetical protein
MLSINRSDLWERSCGSLSRSAVGQRTTGRGLKLAYGVGGGGKQRREVTLEYGLGILANDTRTTTSGESVFFVRVATQTLQKKLRVLNEAPNSLVNMVILVIHVV